MIIINFTVTIIIIVIIITTTIIVVIIIIIIVIVIISSSSSRRHHHHHFPTVVPCVPIIFAALSHALAALLFQELPQLPGLLVGPGALLLKLLVGLRGRAMKAMEC
jgi:O-antigen/teichoic acid export membrane protein